MCLAQGHKAVLPLRLELATPQTQFKHSTTEQLRSGPSIVDIFSVVSRAQHCEIPEVFHLCPLKTHPARAYDCTVENLLIFLLLTTILIFSAT